MSPTRAKTYPECGWRYVRVAGAGHTCPAQPWAPVVGKPRPHGQGKSARKQGK